METDFSSELNFALAQNLKQKAKILFGIFGLILVLQISVISYFLIKTDLFQKIFPLKLVLLGPSFLIAIVLSEFYSIRYFTKVTTEKKKISKSFSFLIVFIEVSFPTMVLLFANFFIINNTILTPLQLLNSPPMIMYFIMIILSSLLLDFYLCVFAGFVAAVEYSILSLILLKGMNETQSTFIDLPNSIIKSVFIFGCGIVAGFVAMKVKESILASLKSKDELINKLDVLVHEKTGEIRKQKDEIEEKNKDITASIQYAKRIQLAILPAENAIKELLNDFFILYRPKDIVSGDFYWIEKFEGKILVAAVDCTGHGVPGAFMSIVGHDLLSQTVFEKHITEPAAILDSLNAEVNKKLKQDDESGVKDGMDLSIISIDEKSKEIRFAGANNPLWLCRNGELIEYKGDKIPIGIHHGEKRSFKSNFIETKKGDTLYLFSDGYADQFGGPKGKKFKYSKLKELLASISNRTMSEQKNTLNATMNDWRGNLEQVDDILVIGIRI